MSSRNFIQRAIKKPGVLRRKAEREHAIGINGNILLAWLRAMAREPGIVGRRARLALTLRGLSKRKRKGKK